LRKIGRKGGISKVFSQLSKYLVNEYLTQTLNPLKLNLDES
jgi:hypothetical protein